VYFVQDRSYYNVYVPHYRGHREAYAGPREEHREDRTEGRREDRREERHEGRHNERHNERPITAIERSLQYRPPFARACDNARFLC